MQTMSQQHPVFSTQFVNHKFAKFKWFLFSKRLKCNFSHPAALTFPCSSPFLFGEWGFFCFLWGFCCSVCLFWFIGWFFNKTGLECLESQTGKDTHKQWSTTDGHLYKKLLLLFFLKKYRHSKHQLLITGFHQWHHQELCKVNHEIYFVLSSFYLFTNTDAQQFLTCFLNEEEVDVLLFSPEISYLVRINITALYQKGSQEFRFSIHCHLTNYNKYSQKDYYILKLVSLPNVQSVRMITNRNHTNFILEKSREQATWLSILHYKMCKEN